MLCVHIFSGSGNVMFLCVMELDAQSAPTDEMRQFQNSSKLSKRPRYDLTKGAFSAVTLQVASANYPLQLFANGIESHFLNDF